MACVRDSGGQESVSNDVERDLDGIGGSRPVRNGGAQATKVWPLTLGGSLVALVLLFGWGGPAQSQLIPLPPKPPQLPTAPPPVQPPALEVPSPRPPGTLEQAVTGPKIMVREIRLVGNTAFTSQQLAEVTAPYTNRELTAEDLEALRLALTYHYINHGYVTSGAVIPEQDVADGTLTMQIMEGKLAEIHIEDTKWFRPSYFQSRINLAAGPPLNVTELEERLQLLQANPRIERLNAELLPGVVRGESTLNARVKEANPFKAWLEFNNYQSPNVGAEQGFVTLAHRNLLGFGDTLSLQYGRSAGVNPMLNFRYEVPVNAHDTTVAVQYRRQSSYLPTRWLPPL